MDYLHATAFQVGLHAGLRAHTHTHTHIHTHCLSVWSIQLFFVADLRPGSSSPAAAFIAAQTSPLGYTILGPEENIKCVFHCPADRESATCCVHCRCCSHCHHALHCTALSCADTRGVSCRAFFFFLCAAGPSHGTTLSSTSRHTTRAHAWCLSAPAGLTTTSSLTLQPRLLVASLPMTKPPTLPVASSTALRCAQRDGCKDVGVRVRVRVRERVRM